MRVSVLVRMVVVGLVVVLALALAVFSALSLMFVLELSLALAPRRAMVFIGACRFSSRRSQGKQLLLMLKAATAFGKQKWRLRARQACVRSWCV